MGTFRARRNGAGVRYQFVNYLLTLQLVENICANEYVCSGLLLCLQLIYSTVAHFI